MVEEHAQATRLAHLALKRDGDDRDDEDDDDEDGS
jgi:hypothetical protein